MWYVFKPSLIDKAVCVEVFAGRALEVYRTSPTKLSQALAAGSQESPWIMLSDIKWAGGSNSLGPCLGNGFSIILISQNNSLLSTNACDPRRLFSSSSSLSRNSVQGVMETLAFQKENRTWRSVLSGDSWFPSSLTFPPEHAAWLLAGNQRTPYLRYTSVPTPIDHLYWHGV